jgi:hypothetical protein
MGMDKHFSATATLNSGGSVIARPDMKMNARLRHVWLFELYRGGKKVWEDGFENLVVTAGLNKYLDATLKTGLASPVWYVALKNTGTVVAADTMASHAGWTENVTYSEATRVAWTPGAVAAGSVDNSASKANFSINGSTTIFGGFLTDTSAKSGATGILLGGGDFGASRAVISGDTLAVTVTCSLT